MAGSNPNDTFFLDAATSGDLKALKKCIRDLGVNINAVNEYGETALINASFGGQILCVNFLIKNRADLEFKGGRQSQTALMKSAGIGDLKCMELLIDAGANLNSVDIAQRTALMEAASNSHTECIRELVRHNAFVNAVDIAGWTALMCAAINGNAEGVEILLKARAIVDVTDQLGQTALMKAASGSHVECVRLLLQFGADVLLTDKTLSSALTKATRDWGIDTLWDNSNLNTTPEAQQQVQQRGFECVKLLCQNGADVNMFDSKGETILMKASAVGFLECVTYLLSIQHTRPEIQIDAINDSGETALLLAVKNGHDRVSGVLLQHGAQVNFSDNLGHTPLLLAVACSNHAKCVAVLLEHGADPNMVDEDRWTPLMHMANVGDAQTMALLINAGAREGMHDKDGFTALDRARKGSHEDAIRLLKIC